MKRTKKIKIVLGTETIRVLSARDLTAAGGEQTGASALGTCSWNCPSFSDPECR